jgi:hypothetical protein
MSLTLYQAGAHLTDVALQHGGEIAIGSGGTGGEHYLRIPAGARADLLRALADAAGQGLPPDMTDEASAEFTMALFEAVFGRSDDDPWADIKEFLKAKGVPFTSEYWPSR